MSNTHTMNEISMNVISEISMNVISEINTEHAAAVRHAGKAIEHAKRAGELLLQVKADLAHGEFLPWIDEHVEVSRRQAQRYMRAAQGKPMTARAIKSDTVSHLSSWLPDDYAVARLAPGVTLSVQRVKHAPECVQFLLLDGSTAHYSRRGFRAEYAEGQIKEVTPPIYYGDGPASYSWKYQSAPDEFLRNLINCIDAMEG